MLLSVLFSDVFLATFIRLAIYSNPLYALCRSGHKPPSERPARQSRELRSRHIRRAMDHAMRQRISRAGGRRFWNDGGEECEKLV